MKAAIVLCVMLSSVVTGKDQNDEDWWKSMSLYQIYPRSYKDSNGDGVGDLKGIMSKLDHLSESNVDAFWMSPIYPSPMVDFGYDISDFRSIDPVFGTMDDFDELLKTANNKSLRVILDFVPNHSSDKHEWFQKSLKSISPYTDYYVWHEGRKLKDGNVTVPNNWVSVFGGPAWTWREERQAYYLHQFAAGQPDLNYNNENVIQEMQNVMRFWLNKGVNGFRVDAVPHLCEDTRYIDEPLSGDTNDPNNYGYTKKVYTKDQPRTYDIVRGWRHVLDEYKGRIMMIEAYTDIPHTMKYYTYGAHYPFNFGMITDLHNESKAADFYRVIDTWMKSMPAGSVANWVAGNHDQPRLCSRFGSIRSQAVTLLTLLLPGVGITYNGDEIGMENTWISWEDTKDPQGCNAGKRDYAKNSRDPARTPFQWDNSLSAGFSTNPKTWLPINPNYETVNLAVEKNDTKSYYNFYKALSLLRKSPILKDSKFTMKLLNDNVLMFSRGSAEGGSIYAIINFGDVEETVDLSTFDNISEKLNLYYATGDTALVPRSEVPDIRNVKISSLGSMVFISVPKILECNSVQHIKPFDESCQK